MKSGFAGRVKWALVLCAAVLLCALLYGMSGRIYYKKAYPITYLEHVLEQNEYEALPNALVMAVIRTESGFNPLAQSSVGARGLMQITEDTFHWAKWKRSAPPADSYEDLFDPRINISYGMYILAAHLNEYGSHELALCAYHAGRGSVNRWLADVRYSQDGATLTAIPFGDTGRYVAKVVHTMEVYEKLYGRLE